MTQQPSHMLITWVELYQLDAMILQVISGNGYSGKEYGLVQIILQDKKNTEADQMSCTFTDDTKWMLSDKIFEKMCEIW